MTAGAQSDLSGIGSGGIEFVGAVDSHRSVEIVDKDGAKARDGGSALQLFSAGGFDDDGVVAEISARSHHSLGGDGGKSRNQGTAQRETLQSVVWSHGSVGGVRG